jgi:hypothetical protein
MSAGQEIASQIDQTLSQDATGTPGAVRPPSDRTYANPFYIPCGVVKALSLTTLVSPSSSGED